MYVIRS